jgi:hypothetical protein
MDDCTSHVGETAAAYLKVEGRVACWHQPGCDYESVVVVRDGPGLPGAVKRP